MVKVKMNYEELYSICRKIVSDIEKDGIVFTEVIAVSRGGLTASHIIAKMLGLPVGVFFPATKFLASNGSQVNYSSNFLVVEDLVAKGRTYKIVKDHLTKISDTRVGPKTFKWKFCPILIDKEWYLNNKVDFDYYGIISDDWIVFPYEDEDAVVVGDHGLFRDNTDKYKDKRNNGK